MSEIQRDNATAHRVTESEKAEFLRAELATLRAEHDCVVEGCRRYEKRATAAAKRDAEEIAELKSCMDVSRKANVGLTEEIARLRAALRAMLAHSCVADTDPDDKDVEDYAAERLARAALAPEPLSKDRPEGKGE